MTVEQLAADLTAEFDECGIITAPMIEENLDLIFDNFIEWRKLLDPDVLQALTTRLEDPTAIYHGRVHDFSFKQRKEALGNVGIVYSGGFEGFEGFEETFKIQKNPFRIDLIPELEPFIKSVSESIQVDPGMISPAVLEVAALSIVKKCVIHTMGDHREPPNLYIAVIAEPSERKSPTMKEVTWPVYEYEREENERREPDITEYRMKKSILEKRMKSMMEAAASIKKRKDPVQEADIIEVQRELNELEEVAPLRLIVDDVTAEVLIKLLSQNDERMAIMSTEGGIFGNIAGRYSSDPNMDVYLKGYSGDHLSVDRVTRSGQTLHEPLLSVLVYVQPVVIEEVMSNPELVRRGLPARFLYAQPPSMIGRRKYDVKPIPEYRKDELWNIINRLLNIPTPEKPIEVEPDAAALKLADRFFYEVEREILNAPSPELRAWIGKLHGNTMRIALVLHCIKHVEQFGDHKVDAQTMQNAIEYGRFFLGQAKIVYAAAGLADPPEIRDAKYILEKIDSTGKTEMKLRDIQQMCREREGLETKDKMIPGINCLIKLGFIRVEKSSSPSQNPQNPQKGGRPSEIIYVNPEYLRRKEQHI